MNMFEKASRLALRFDVQNGQLAVEHLWNLPLQSKTKVNLDDIAKGLYGQLKSVDTVSFVSDKAEEDDLTQLKFDIVRYIIEVKKNENKQSLEEKQNSEKKQKIMAIIAMKKEKELLDTPIEELEKML